MLKCSLYVYTKEKCQIGPYPSLEQYDAVCNYAFMTHHEQTAVLEARRLPCPATALNVPLRYSILLLIGPIYDKPKTNNTDGIII